MRLRTNLGKSYRRQSYSVHRTIANTNGVVISMLLCSAFCSRDTRSDEVPVAIEQNSALPFL